MGGKTGVARLILLLGKVAMNEEGLKRLLPPQIAGRVQSARLANGTATLVVDAAGVPERERGAFEAAINEMLQASEEVDEVRIALVADRAERRPLRKILAIGSGKGGVGKSTLTANLAVALARGGRKIGVVDADIYGPSMPTIFGTEGMRPRAEGDALIPIAGETGIPHLSIGHLVEPGRAIAWRGPMVGKAMAQMIEANWDDTELLLVDLPPGTGDVQLTMLQRFRPAGAVIVSTPQDLALIDARRAAQLFEAGDVPIAGLVENMAGYACPHCGEISDPFGSGGVEAAAAAMGVPFFGRIPLALEIREASDAGRPPAAGDGEQASAFAEIAAHLSDWVDRQEAAA